MNKQPKRNLICSIWHRHTLLQAHPATGTPYYRHTLLQAHPTTGTPYYRHTLL